MTAVPLNEASLPSSVAALTRRVLLMTWRNKPVVIVAVVQGVVFLLIFRYVLGGAISTGGSLSYVDYLAPGLLCVGVLFSVMRIGSAVAEEVQRGVVARFRSMPMPRVSILLGRSLADLAVTTFVLLVTAVFAVLVGFRPSRGLLGLLVVLGLCVVVALAFGWVFVVVGLAFRDTGAAQGVGFLVMPLSFVSSAYVPVESMPSWLRPFAEYQPVTVIVDASRYLAHGYGESSSVLVALVWCAGILAVSVTVALRLFRR
jgi:ABC transporter DrrB family efflux protein